MNKIMHMQILKDMQKKMDLTKNKISSQQD